MRLILILAIFTIIAKNAAATPDLTGYHLSFFDEFKTLSISDASVYRADTLWYTQTKACCGVGNSNFYSSHNPYSLIPGGGLDIRATNWQGAGWSTGEISSAAPDGKGFSQCNGYFEGSFKLPNGPGTWPAFWMLPPNGAPCSGEIDIFETYGPSTGVNVTLHDWTNNNSETTQFDAPNLYNGNYHTVGMLWTSSLMTFYLDGVSKWTVAPMAVMKNCPYYILLDMGMNSPGGSAVSPSDLMVKYIRAWSNSGNDPTVVDPVLDTLVPVVNKPAGAYADSLILNIIAFGSGVAIHYTLDNTAPSVTSPLYTGPFTIKNTVTLKVAGFFSGRSSVVETLNYSIVHSVAQPTSAGVHYKYYEYTAPSWDSLSHHNLSTLTPASSGVLDSFNLAIPGRKTSCFAVHYDGVIKIDSAATYAFFLYSNAGSILSMGGVSIVNNDGRHAITTLKTGTVFLNKGCYPITVDYFRDTTQLGANNMGLAVYYQPSNGLKTVVPKAKLFTTTTAVGRTARVGTFTESTVSFSSVRNDAFSVSLPHKSVYEIRIARVNGKTIKSISAERDGTYTFSRQELGTGVFLVTVIEKRDVVSRIMTLY